MNLRIDLTNNPVGEKGRLLNPSNDGDAGYDLLASSGPMINGAPVIEDYYRSVSYIEYDTNIVLNPEKGEEGYSFYPLLFPRSSISNYNLILANSVGVIDSGYRNTIKVRFKYIIQPEDIYLLEEKDKANVKYPTTKINMGRIYKKGDKIAQLVFSRHIHPELIGRKDDSSKETRGLDGFGSSGK